MTEERVKREFVAFVLAAVAVAGALGVLIAWFLPVAGPRDLDARELPPGWNVTVWPFAPDPFAPGAAYACRAPDCDAPLRITVRAKMGFCDCEQGVADDDMLHQIGDVVGFGRNYTPREPGRVIEIGAMRGRSRAYVAPGLSSPVWSIAFNRRCDVIVATASGADTPDRLARVMAFLRSDGVLKWADRTLGR